MIEAVLSDAEQKQLDSNDNGDTMPKIKKAAFIDEEEEVSTLRVVAHENTEGYLGRRKRKRLPIPSHRLVEVLTRVTETILYETDMDKPPAPVSPNENDKSDGREPFAPTSSKGRDVGIKPALSKVDGHDVIVPKHWIPRYELLIDPMFLSACGLGHQYEREYALSNLLSNQTPSASTAALWLEMFAAKQKQFGENRKKARKITGMLKAIPPSTSQPAAEKLAKFKGKAKSHQPLSLRM
uniref:Uncharacterized protein n=1 Tax=Chenopodium quinoa TaxID=63459 RepID=A0A803MSR8_CHEQI